MRKYPEKPDNKEYSQEECRQITISHRKLLTEIMDIFYDKLRNLWENNDKDKEILKNLEKYKLQHLIQIVWDQVISIFEKDNNYNENLERYIRRWLPENLATICRNTSIDLWDTMHEENNEESIEKKSIEITKIHKKTITDIMDIFYDKLKNLWENHDKDKETPGNLERYTYLLNHPNERAINKEWKKIHNHNNTHHVEWFLECNEPKLQYLVEMVCDNVATAIARGAKYMNIFEENKQRYIKKWLSKEIALICANTFVDLWNAVYGDK